MSQPLEVYTLLQPPKVAALPPHTGSGPGAAWAEGRRPTPCSGAFGSSVPVFVPTALHWRLHGFQRLFLTIVTSSPTPAPFLAHSLGFPVEFASLLHRRPGLADGSGCKNKTKKTLKLLKPPLSHSGGKKDRKDAAFSVLREHRSASHAAGITWRPGRAPELGKYLGTRRTNGHRRPAVSCASSRVTSEPQFPFLTGMCGCPGAAPRLLPLNVLSPATMRAPAQPGLRAQGVRRVIRGPEQSPIHLISVGTAVCCSYCPLKQMSVVVMRARPHEGSQEVSERGPAIEHAQKNFRQEAIITQGNGARKQSWVSHRDKEL